MAIKSDYKINFLSNQNRGFGLIELIVSIGIMVFVMSIIMVKHSSFNGATLLRGQAYKVALAVRELQLLAISSTNVGVSHRNVYGLVIKFTGLGTTFGTFLDKNGNNYWDSATEDLEQQTLLDRRFEISRIKLMTGNVSADVSEFFVVFERPNFDARIFTGLNTEALSSVTGVEIDIRVKGTSGNGPGELRTIEITRTGQITVKNI